MIILWFAALDPVLVKKNWGSLSLPSRFKPDLGLFRTFGVDLSTSPGCGCRRPSPCVGLVGIEPTLTTCKPSGLTARQAGPLSEILFQEVLKQEGARRECNPIMISKHS